MRVCDLTILMVGRGHLMRPRMRGVPLEQIEVHYCADVSYSYALYRPPQPKRSLRQRIRRWLNASDVREHSAFAAVEIDAFREDGAE